MRRGTAIASLLTSVLLTVGLCSSVALAAKDGRKCQNVGAVLVTDSITYICVKFDRKLKWVANAHQTWMSDVVAIVNKVRSDSGLNSLSECQPLNRSAQLHSQDMNARDFFDHTNPDGKSPADRIRLTGYFGKAKSLWTGENIAAGFADPASVMAAWMKSPGHRANILNAKFTQLGVGIATTRSDSKYGGYIWTQNFGAGGTC